MYPVNQVFLGGDPMMSSLDDLDMQIQRMEAYRNKLKQIQAKPQIPTKLIWDEVDAEVNPMTDEQKARLFQNEDYVMNYNEIQALVQSEILNLVKGRIESTERGRELLSSQLKIVRKLKTKIIDDTNKEMEMFMKFKEFSKANPTVTYEEFIKSNMQ
jgi:hypothetical protein